MQKINSRKDNKGRVLIRGESQRSSDGMYIYSYQDPYEMKRRYVYATTLEQLREKEDELKKNQLDGLDIYANGRATVNEGFDRYIQTKFNLRETTKTNYLYMYNHFVRDNFGTRKMSDVKFTDVKLFYLYLINEKNMAVNTVDTIHTILHPTFEMAVRDGILRTNPTKGVMAEIMRSAGKNKGVRHALTAEEQIVFIRAVRSSPDYCHWNTIFTTLLGTGMRIGECAGLRWDDVDFNKKVISVNHAATYYGREGKCCFKISAPKTEAGIRYIPMFDEVYDVLKEEYERQCKEGFNRLELDGMTRFVFVNRFGNLNNPYCINRAIERILDQYNSHEVIQAKKEHREPVILPHFSCHVLRHSFCSRLVEADVNPKVTQEIMGHANIQTTLDIYAEVGYNKKKDVFAQLNKEVDFFGTKED